jgi:flagellar assembly protein FliH
MMGTSSLAANARMDGAEQMAASWALHARRDPATQKTPLTAWQRWEMSAIAGKPASGRHESCPADASALPGHTESPTPMDESALAGLRLQAQQEGEAAGRLLGYAQGHAEGFVAATAELGLQASQLRALTLALPAALSSAQHDVAEDLLDLALEIARQVLGQALTADPQIILRVVRDLLHTEPALTGSPQLVVHPEDATLVKEYLGEDLQAAGWRIRPDARIKRGGCQVLAASGEHDATVETRWKRVSAALMPHTRPSVDTSAPHG